jgi:hypothetical protein
MLTLQNFLSYILLVLKGGPTFLVLREIIYRYKMDMAPVMLATTDIFSKFQLAEHDA